jgi:hypothetical protein
MAANPQNNGNTVSERGSKEFSKKDWAINVINNSRLTIRANEKNRIRIILNIGFGFGFFIGPRAMKKGKEQYKQAIRYILVSKDNISNDIFEKNLKFSKSVMVDIIPMQPHKTRPIKEIILEL